jgi:hypothetical protein
MVSEPSLDIIESRRALDEAVRIMSSTYIEGYKQYQYHDDK